MQPTAEQLKDPVWWDANAPEGATHWTPYENVCCQFLKKDGVDWLWWNDKVWRDFIGPSWEYQLIGIVERPSALIGQGLPPVGAVCEVENEMTGGWDAVDSILAHAVVLGSSVAVFQIGSLIAYAKAASFRPIRTPEQIAAEKREKAIKAMEPVAAEAWRATHTGSDVITEICSSLYDAGYRLVEGGAQ